MYLYTVFGHGDKIARVVRNIREGLSCQPEAHHNGAGHSDEKDPVARSGITVGFHKGLASRKRWTSVSVSHFVQTMTFGMVPFVLYAVILLPRAVGLLRID